jgi:hypothetical protein
MWVYIYMYIYIYLKHKKIRWCVNLLDLDADLDDQLYYSLYVHEYTALCIYPRERRIKYDPMMHTSAFARKTCASFGTTL